MRGQFSWQGTVITIAIITLVFRGSNWQIAAVACTLIAALGLLSDRFKKQEENKDDKVSSYMRQIPKDSKLEFIKEHNFGSSTSFIYGFDDGFIYHVKHGDLTFEFWLSKFDTLQEFGENYHSIPVTHMHRYNLRRVHQNNQLIEKL